MLSFRTPVFDAFFVGFIPLFALLVSLLVYVNPDLFRLVLFLNLALLGYHHVIATYTRLTVTNLGRAEHRFLVYILPVLVAAFVFLCVNLNQLWLVPTIYLHWQWWHYIRQSEGIMKSVSFKTKSGAAVNGRVERFTFYLVPVAAIVEMSSRQFETFLYMPIQTIPVPEGFADFLIYASLFFLVWVFVRAVNRVKAGEQSLVSFVYQISHYVIYLYAYIWMDDISFGWLAINIWHNFQYIVFVWHSNNTLFKEGVDRNQLVLSWLSQSEKLRVCLYFSIGVAVTYVFYSFVDHLIGFANEYTDLPLVVIAYQTINFHHYVVDTLIWKLRKPKVRQSVGLEA